MKNLTSRLILLAVFGLTFFGIFWLIKNGQNQANNPGPAITDEGFQPSGPGKAVLVEFADFECPACGYYYPFVKQLRSDYGDKLTIVYKYFPLRQIHPNAQIAAQAGEAARLQNKFNEMEDQLFTNQDQWASLSNDAAKQKFVSYAQSLGMNKDQFLKDMDSTVASDAVEKDYQQGAGLGVNSTPTFYLNGIKLNNPASYDGFKSLIDQALAGK